jgi:salicylate biosynthesis isochorismate synthase/menaquinone-specific isochorismate synthase
VSAPSAARHPDLASAAAAAARRADASGRQQWVSLSEPAPPCDGLALFASAAGEGFFWEHRAEARQIAALGAAQVVETAGAGRFADAARALQVLSDDLHLFVEEDDAETDPSGGAAPDTEPLLVGGFAFAEAPAAGPEWRGFPPGRLVLPELLYTRSSSGTRCTVTRAVEPGTGVERASTTLRKAAEAARSALRAAGRAASSAGHAPEFRAAADAPHERYRAAVREALRAIGDGDLEKVVLARAVNLTSTAGFDAAAILDTLRRAHPSCTCFAVTRPEGTFLGATPERLVRLRGNRVEAAALAGSARRGRSPEEDARLGRELCESKKEQAEHAVVVRALRDALDDACTGIEAPEAPRLLRLEGIQHLETPVSGTLRRAGNVLELVERLHPTPAVAGAPRAAALAWLATHEEVERGWYAGPVGTVHRDGGGEFCIALRSALLRGKTARLFAGAGIVDGSRPDAELRETQLKLRAMLGALVEL